MTQIFNELAIVEDAIGDSDRIVHILASLPESYDMLVTAFEAHKAVPDMQVITERLKKSSKIVAVAQVTLQVEEP